jgi:phosphohistidine phosphatase
MKTILFMRHAKSTWDGKTEDDFERQISKRGIKDAERIGKLLKKEKLTPEVILSSTAVRAEETTGLVVKELKYHGDLYYLNKLYLGEPEVYVQQIQNLPDDVQTVLLIGHNPTLDSLLQMITEKVETLSTAAVAQVTLPIDSWKDFNLQVHGELVSLWRPKEL